MRIFRPGVNALIMLFSAAFFQAHAAESAPAAADDALIEALVEKGILSRAEADSIPYQLELLSGGTTDAAAIQMARSGVPSGCISIPCRFIHTTSETVDTGDVQACVDLLAGLLANPAELN